MRRNRLTAVVVAASVASMGLVGSNMAGAAGKGADEAAVERTRQTVRMLDDLYKTAVVLITTHYVEEDSDLPAGSAAIALFSAMKEKGWHEVRLLDATGEPLVDTNAPNDRFEKQAVRELKGGSSWYEQIVERDGTSYLRVATPIPVVLEKCTLCHDNYKNVEAGAPIGALGYTIEIQ